MLRRFAVLAMALALLLPFAACKKKEPAKEAEPAAGIFVPPVEPQVVMPENVKGKWSAVRIVVEDKASGKTQEVAINVGADYNIPNSNLKVSVVEFLPDFRMEGTVITSASNDPNNPAARVKIYEADKEVFKGWLYAKFPAIHPFQHDKFGLTLKEGTKKK